MPATNGVAATLEYLQRQVDKLEENKASKEAVTNIKQGLEELKESFEGLKRILITVALSWVAGTGLFLIAVLTLAAKSGG
jgi:prefoldin subunit 5